MSVKDYVLEDIIFLNNANTTLRQIVFNKKKEDIERNDILNMVHKLNSLLELYDHYIIESNVAVFIIDELVFQFLLKECDIDLEDDHYSSFRETLDKTLHLVSTRFAKSGCCVNTIIQYLDWLANCVDSIFEYDVDDVVPIDYDDMIDTVLVD
jgi:hypothetical protein